MDPTRRSLCRRLAACAFLTLSTIASQPAFAATNVGGQITTNTTWTLANSPYVVVGNVNVWGIATLTIQPGVVVKFNHPLRMISVDGTLIAVGNAGSRIVFTSIQDDTIGGDTGGDGPTTGSPGQWGTVRVAGTATLDYVDMRFGGSGSGYLYALFNVHSGGDATVDHSTFSSSQWGGMHVSGNTSTADVAHSVFTQNKFGASFYGAAATIRANSLISSNTEYGVFMTYTSSYAGGPGVVNNSEITNNGLQGVLLWVDPGIAALSAPRGTGNNIHNNAGGGTAIQYGSLHHVPQSDWSGNYWGYQVYQIDCPWAPPATVGYHMSVSNEEDYCDDPNPGPVAAGLFSTAVQCPDKTALRCASDAISSFPAASGWIDNSGY